MDSNKRVVALSNLEAMCERISGTCHRYTVSNVQPHRVVVQYSNPDEYGNESPMDCYFPSWQVKGWGHDGMDTFVVLDILRVTHDNRNGEGWQAFQSLLDCPELFRSNPDSNDWQSREEIEKAKQVPV